MSLRLVVITMHLWSLSVTCLFLVSSRSHLVADAFLAGAGRDFALQQRIHSKFSCRLQMQRDSGAIFQEGYGKDKQVRKPVKKLPFFSGVRYLAALSRGRHPQYQKELVEKHQESFIIWNKYVTLANVDEIRDVLEGYNLEKPQDNKDAFKVIFFPTGGILGADFEDWKVQRRLTAPSLSEAVVGNLGPKFEQSSMPFFQLLEDASESGRIVEMDEAFVALGLDTIGLILLGKPLGQLNGLLRNEVEQESFLNALTIMGTEATRQGALPRWVLKYKLWRPSRKVLKAKRVIEDFLDACIEEREANVDSCERNDLISILLRAEVEGQLTRSDVKAQLLTFLFAGYDTTAHTMSFLLYEVANDSRLQNDLASETRKVLPERESFPLDFRALSQEMKLLERVWKETLRKYPAAAGGTQRVTGNDSIVVGNGVEIPPNTIISISPYAIQHNERYWPRPDIFDPSRFDAEIDAQRDPYTLLTFSAGPRNCIGSRLAKAEVMTIMTVLLRRFHVRCQETDEPFEQTLFTTKPRDGIRFSFERRL